jgi:hypothetical protein
MKDNRQQTPGKLMALIFQFLRVRSLGKAMKNLVIILTVIVAFAGCKKSDSVVFFENVVLSPDITFDQRLKTKYSSILSRMDEQPISDEKETDKFFRLTIIPTIGKPHIIKLTMRDSVIYATYKMLGDDSKTQVRNGVDIVELNYSGSSVEMDSLMKSFLQHLMASRYSTWHNEYDLEAGADGIWYLFEIWERGLVKVVFRWDVALYKAYSSEESEAFETIINSMYGFIPHCILQPNRVKSVEDLPFPTL